jgi:riboflavin synthase
VTVRDPADAIGRLNRWNSGADGESPDGRQHAHGEAFAGLPAVSCAFLARPGALIAKGLEGAVFTGIIEELGKVAAVDRQTDSAKLTIDGPLVSSSAASGGSIAVNGVCLTVTATVGSQFSADVMGETLARSTLGTLAPGGQVNLERPAPVGGRLDGHIVQGHADGTGVITERRPAERWDVLRISIPAGLSRYIAEKCSVAVDGVSLTVSAVSDLAAPGTDGQGDWFEVSLIPETLARTTLGTVKAGDLVNLEVDVIAKYVERLLAGGAAR